MENSSPLAHPNNGQSIFAALRDVLADLYPEENAARVVVADAGLDAKQIPFSSRAQTNWHNILAEAIRQARLDPLLKIALADYAINPALLAAYGQYRLLIEQGGFLAAPASLPADADLTIAGDVKLNEGDFVGHDKLIAGDDVGGDKVEGDKIDAHASQGFLNRPTAPVTQHFGTAINIGALQIPIYLVIIISVCIFGIFSVVVYPFVEQWLPSSRAFAAQANSETLIVIATFHNTAATDSEAHTKIRRAIVDAAASHNEQQLRVEVEPTELNADQRTEAETLGKRYNASMVIWGEDTGVEVIVNFLNLKEPNFDAAAATITERERTQLANPSAYTRFITQALPQTMSFFAFFAIGQSYYLSAQYILAIERIEAAVTFVPPEVKPVGLAEAYFRLGWLYQVPTPADLAQALANYDQAIHLNPDFAEAYNNRGIVRSDQGDLEEALADYTRSIELNNPKLHLPYYNRSLAFKAQGKLAEALSDYDQAIHLNPDFADAYNNRGIAHYDQYRLDEAIADYTRSIELNNPKLHLPYYNRGLAFKAQGKLAEALSDYDQAIHLNPGFADAYNNRGIIHYDQDKLTEALADYNQAIHFNPSFADAYNNRGIAHYDQDKLDEAIADYTRSIKLNNPKLHLPYYNRGLAFKAQGKLVEALSDYDQAIHFNPSFADAFWGRGLAYRTLGKLKEALANFRRYLELQPNTEHREQFEQWIAEAEAELAKLK